MRCRVRSLKTAALVNRDIHQHRALAHGLKVRAADQFGCSGAWNQNAADHQVGVLQMPFNGAGGGKNGLNTAGEGRIQEAHDRGTTVQYDHPGTQANRHLSGVESDRATSDDHDLGRLDTRHAAEQYTRPAAGFLKAPGTGLDRQATRNL